MNERMIELLDQFLDGELPAEQVAELDAILSENPELASVAADRFAEHRLIGIALREDHKTDDILEAIAFEEDRTVQQIVVAAVRDNSRRVADVNRSTLVALVLAVMALIGLSGWIGTQDERGRIASTNVGTPAQQVPRAAGPTADRSVAMLLLDEDCQWAGEGVYPEGSPLPSSTLWLESGLAVIRFGGGAEAILRGPTKIELINAGAARVFSGNVVVRASEEAAGFRIWTPSSELIDLGTEFAVSVDPDGQTTLSVIEGEVSVRPLEAKQSAPQVLPAGRAVAIATPQSTPRDVAAVSESFSSIVKRAKPTSQWKNMDAYEGFYYEPGTYRLSECKRGKGWLGPWRERTIAEGYREDQDVADTLTIVSGQMNVTWPIPGGQQGMLEFPPGFTCRIREMGRPLALGEAAIRYISFMVREPDWSKRDRRMRPQEGVRLTFRSSDDYYGESLSFGIGASRRAQIQHGIGIGVRSSGQTPSNQTTLWIAKIVSNADANDEIYFRVFGEDEELSYAEPAEWDVVSRDVSLSARLNLAVLTSHGVAPRIVDELRIGPTWRSVAPMKED